MIIKSIRWRLQAWHGVILVAVLLGFGLTAYHVVRDNQLRRVDQELDQRLMALGRPPPPPQSAERASDQFPNQPPGQPGDNRPNRAAEIIRQMSEAIRRGGGFDPLATNTFYYVLLQKDG